MAEWHLDELRAALERLGWRLVAEHPGDNYRISASWEIERSCKNALVDFNGLDDINTLPAEKAYGCHVREIPRLELYFASRGEKGSSKRSNWKNELKRFVDSLD